jgi:hypothetical protein
LDGDLAATNLRHAIPRHLLVPVPPTKPVDERVDPEAPNPAVGAGEDGSDSVMPAADSELDHMAQLLPVGIKDRRADEVRDPDVAAPRALR